MLWLVLLKIRLAFMAFAKRRAWDLWLVFGVSEVDLAWWAHLV